MFLFAQVRHTLSQLVKRDQFLLICSDHAFNVVLNPRLPASKVPLRLEVSLEQVALYLPTGGCTTTL